jgi:hypothetical protein
VDSLASFPFLLLSLHLGCLEDSQRSSNDGTSNSTMIQNNKKETKKKYTNHGLNTKETVSK